MALHRISQGKIEQTFRQEEYDGKKILLGHYFETLDALVASQAYSLIVYGHTHEPEMRKQGQTLVLNPGECGAWLYGESTVAVVDLDSLEGEIVTLP
ncbi:MAG: metallophosphoesterase family protein [Deltaproteobacteria bacterium]|nr:metallophosphoesterase family protein [Deltaproteobacteria bacterium]MBW1930237.1 metallophosphoesterase family protein [Deltaproteobacteria bacterium]MBW2024300.1 metallophosphoesterase family protein [Deltaproteobacteria bacterium]MBW2125325.1 metallophosphoesterase family protein [Deltaproteobacteria bacterium]